MWCHSKETHFSWMRAIWESESSYPVGKCFCFHNVSCAQTQIRVIGPLSEVWSDLWHTALQTQTMRRTACIINASNLILTAGHFVLHRRNAEMCLASSIGLWLYFLVLLLFAHYYLQNAVPNPYAIISSVKKNLKIWIQVWMVHNPGGQYKLLLYGKRTVHNLAFT